MSEDLIIGGNNPYIFTGSWLQWMNTQPVTYQASLVWVPPQEARAAIPAVAPTKTIITQTLNKGWNSHARSVDELMVGKALNYTVASGVSGCFLGIGENNKDNASIASFKHGILVNNSGVWVYENGVKINQLLSSHTPTTKIRIYRQQDNTIVYFIISGGRSIIYTSQLAPNLMKLYSYCFLYSAQDSVNSSEFITGQVQFARA